MRKGFLRAVAVLLAGSGLAVAAPPARRTPVPTAEPPLFVADQPARPAGKPNSAPAAAVPAGQAAPAKPAVLPDKCGDPCAKDCPDPCLPKCCEVCGPPGRCWVSAEYLLWWIRSANTPPLVTTSPD